MVSKEINIRNFRPEDAELFERWRQMFMEGDLEIPMGFSAPGVETAVAEYQHHPIASLTLTLAAMFDPLIKLPDVPNAHAEGIAGPAMIQAIVMLERALAFLAQRQGAVVGYIGVPDSLPEYQKIVEKAGYKRTFTKVSVFRRPFRPDTVPLLGEERDKAIVEAAEAAEAVKVEEEQVAAE